MYINCNRPFACYRMPIMRESRLHVCKFVYGTMILVNTGFVPRHYMEGAETLPVHTTMPARKPPR